MKDILFCPNCDEQISTDNLQLLDVFECRTCDTRLEVVDVNPIDIAVCDPDDEVESDVIGDEDEEEEL
jgi:hypothetical protein